MPRRALLTVAVAAALLLLLVVVGKLRAPAPGAVMEARSPTGATPLPEPISEAAPTASSAPAAVSAGAAAQPAPGPSVAELGAAATTLKRALVNIICVTPEGSPFHSISASGIFVGAKGYILTNAHVAAYLLLGDQGVECVLRTGNPARVAYTAKLAYLPTAWVERHARALTDASPLGTGEHDFALLVVSASATEAPLPATFPAIPLAYAPPAVGTPTVVGTYGAQALSLTQIATALSPTIAASSVKRLLTYGATTPDVLDLGGSAAAQEGSSGGGVLGFGGTLLGSVTTSTTNGTFAARTLSAITASYIRRTYQAETGQGIDTLLATPPAAAASAFAAKSAPALEAALLAANQ